MDIRTQVFTRHVVRIENCDWLVLEGGEARAGEARPGLLERAGGEARPGLLEGGEAGRSPRGRSPTGVAYDRCGRYPEFIEHFHKMVARSQNALRGRWENFWSSEQTCIVRLEDRAAVMDRLVYAATSPVKDYLVERVHYWPGVNGLAALLNRRPLCATRPTHFFRPDGSMPDAVELRLVIPPELGPEAEVLAELRQRVQAVEEACAAERQRTGRRVYGRRAVRQQSWRDQPSSAEPRRILRPRIAARSVWVRIEALQRNRAFLADYAMAREAWLHGAGVMFLLGTYWLRRFANVRIAEA